MLTCSSISVRVVTTVVILECEDLNERVEKGELARGSEETDERGVVVTVDVVGNFERCSSGVLGGKAASGDQFERGEKTVGASGVEEGDIRK